MGSDGGPRTLLPLGHEPRRHDRHRHRPQHRWPLISLPVAVHARGLRASLLRRRHGRLTACDSGWGVTGAIIGVAIAGAIALVAGRSRSRHRAAHPRYNRGSSSPYQPPSWALARMTVLARPNSDRTLRPAWLTSR